MNVDYTTMAQGDDSGYRIASRMVIDNDKQWADIWHEHASDLVPSPPAPKVDFAHEMVIAVFAGEKPTSGYSVEIVRVETQRSRVSYGVLLVVKVRYRRIGNITEDVITKPYHIIRIPRIDFARVVFELA